MSHETAVKILHLVGGGAPIIAKCTPTKMGCVFLLEDPLYLYYNTDVSVTSGKDTFGVNKLLALSDETSIEIDKDKVLFSYFPSKKLLDHYNNILMNQLELLPEE